MMKIHPGSDRATCHTEVARSSGGVGTDRATRHGPKGPCEREWRGPSVQRTRRRRGRNRHGEES
jgi:hypothetical protein